MEGPTHISQSLATIYNHLVELVKFFAVDLDRIHKQPTKLRHHTPESANFHEPGNQVTTEVQRHEALQPADARPAYEDSRGRRTAAVFGGRGEGADLVLLHLYDRGVDPDGGEEPLHDVAHAAGGPAEDDHGVLGYQPLDPRLGGLFHVDGQRGGGGGRQLQPYATVDEGAVTTEVLHQRV
ncbi:hypothetical protein RJ639_023272 [Escallonia herrerae]|uniref:Uncharacterized protein n=1 Tax=Escallonia herrerae TaxID=1293975 RepID=A0AA88UYG6_9ASTE|nr:hypothetical protein RJ639_023272 [Escallonia herrerae]